MCGVMPGMPVTKNLCECWNCMPLLDRCEEWNCNPGNGDSLFNECDSHAFGFACKCRDVEWIELLFMVCGLIFALLKLMATGVSMAQEPYRYAHPYGINHRLRKADPFSEQAEAEADSRKPLRKGDPTQIYSPKEFKRRKTPSELDAERLQQLREKQDALELEGEGRKLQEEELKELQDLEKLENEDDRERVNCRWRRNQASCAHRFTLRPCHC